MCVWAPIRSTLTRSTWPNSPTPRVQTICKSLKVAGKRNAASSSDLLRRKGGLFAGPSNFSIDAKEGDQASYSCLVVAFCMTSGRLSTTNPPLMSLKVLEDRKRFYSVTKIWKPQGSTGEVPSRLWSVKSLTAACVMKSGISPCFLFCLCCIILCVCVCVCVFYQLIWISTQMKLSSDTKPINFRQ